MSLKEAIGLESRFRTWKVELTLQMFLSRRKVTELFKVHRLLRFRARNVITRRFLFICGSKQPPLIFPHSFALYIFWKSVYACVYMLLGQLHSSHILFNDTIAFDIVLANPI